MSSVLTKPVLVLNKLWTPVRTVSLEVALNKICSTYADGTPKALIIHPESMERMTWDDWSKLKVEATDEVIRGVNMHFKIPEVMLLSRYEKMPFPKVNFNRRTLYKRDNNQCQYCGATPGTDGLSIDHVVPRALGGGTTWTNCVLACISCNARKADKTLAQSGMRLRSVPKKPKFDIFKCDTKLRIKSWQNFLGEAYWSVTLENDEE